MGMFLRRGTIGPFAVILTGEGFDSRYNYATIDGTKYKAAETLELEYGSTIEIHVSAAAASYQKDCYITLDGETVQSGAGDYLYKIKSNATLTFGTKAARFFCDIVTS